MLETAYITMNRLLRAIPVRTQKAKRRTADKVSIFLEKTCHPEQDLMGISSMMAIMMRSQMEMRTMLLDTGGKAILPREMRPPLLWTGKASSLQLWNWRVEGGGGGGCHAQPSQGSRPLPQSFWKWGTLPQWAWRAEL